MSRISLCALMCAALCACHELADAPADAAPSACLFGAVFSDIRDNPLLVIEREEWLRSLDALGDALSQAQLVLAVQQSSHTDVREAGEALSRLDQQEVRRIQLLEPARGRRFTVYEYGVGDNSYGAFFEAGSTTLVAAIHDGDVTDCKVSAAAPAAEPKSSRIHL